MRKFCKFFAAGCLFCFMLSFGSWASEEIVPRDRPDPDGTPTRVQIAAYFTDLSGISSVDQSFTPTFIVMVRWRDPRLACEEAAEKDEIRKRPIDEVWNPRILILNQKRIFEFFNPKGLVEISPDGTVSFVEQYFGELVFPMDLREFPFDSHVLPLTIISGKYGPSEVLFEVDMSRVGRNEVFSIADWDVGPVRTKVGKYAIDARETDLSRVDFQLAARRYPGFYISRVIMPLVFIVFMSFSVFWIDPKTLGTQLSVATTSILTLIAFQFAVNTSLPRIFYLTRIDTFILGATIVVFCAFVEAVVTSFMAKTGRRERALSVDRKARVLFPLAFFALGIFSLML